MSRFVDTEAVQYILKVFETLAEVENTIVTGDAGDEYALRVRRVEFEYIFPDASTMQPQPLGVSIERTGEEVLSINFDADEEV